MSFINDDFMLSNGTAKELYHGAAANMPIIDANVEELVYAGDSRIKFVPVAGLEGTDKIVAAPYDALVYATDVEDSEGIFKMWFDEKEDKCLFKVLFTAGTAVKYADEVVLYSAE